MKWVWTAWLILIVVSFAVFEGYALSHDDGLSLSQYLWNASKAWPPLPWVIGNFTGGLAVHLWWHWVPADQKEPDRG
jgi:hypothetical protein